MTSCRANISVAVIDGKLFAVGGFSGNFPAAILKKNCKQYIYIFYGDFQEKYFWTASSIWIRRRWSGRRTSTGIQRTVVRASRAGRTTAAAPLANPTCRPSTSKAKRCWFQRPLRPIRAIPMSIRLNLTNKLTNETSTLHNNPPEEWKKTWWRTLINSKFRRWLIHFDLIGVIGTILLMCIIHQREMGNRNNSNENRETLVTSWKARLLRGSRGKSPARREEEKKMRDNKKKLFWKYGKKKKLFVVKYSAGISQ